MQLTYLISADYARATGGWIYNERLLAELAILGWRINRIELPAGFPDPDDSALRIALQIADDLPDGALVLGDQVCLSPLNLWMLLEGQKHRFAVIVHHPQILEGSRPSDIAARLDADERQAMEASDCIIATSRATGQQLLSDYAVSADRLVVAQAGIDDAPPATGSNDGSVQLLSVGSVIPRKRHDLIVAALAEVRDLDWRLTVVGNIDREPEHVARLRDLIARLGLGDRVTLAGEKTPAALGGLWSGADIYVAAAAHEGFGLAIAEAVMRQLPVVTTRSGAVADWLDPRAAVIIDGDEPATLAAALRSVIADPALRSRLRDGCVAARAVFPTWSQAAAKVDQALRALVI